MRLTSQCIFRALSSFGSLLHNLDEMALGTVVRFLELLEAFAEGGISSETCLLYQLRKKKTESTYPSDSEVMRLLESSNICFNFPFSMRSAMLDSFKPEFSSVVLTKFALVSDKRALSVTSSASFAETSSREVARAGRISFSSQRVVFN